jgi:ABC-type microcin C transport system permease subunit YejB
MVFIAYSIPGWTAGVLLLMLLGGNAYFDLVPLGGKESTVIVAGSKLSAFLQDGAPAAELPAEIRKEYPKMKDNDVINSSHPAFTHIPAEKRRKLETGRHEDLDFVGRLLDRMWHMALPGFCYVLGLFASKTVLMKNSLMENLGQDYVRTAFAKGLSENTVIFKHALRNSLIPIATGLGHMLSIILAGSYLIEKVFNIQGFGLLGYESLIARDYPVTLGILVIGSMLKLFGNIVSDVLYCLIDPRIRFS